MVWIEDDVNTLKGEIQELAIRCKRMPEYNLGTLKVTSHEVEKLTQALDLPDDRFDDLVGLARRAWEYEDTISESILAEYGRVVKKTKKNSKFLTWCAS